MGAMEMLDRARATVCFVLWVMVLFIVRQPAAYGQVLGYSPEDFIEQARSWADEAGGFFYAACHIGKAPYPEYSQDAYLIMPRTRLDSVLVLVTRDSDKGRIVVNVGTMEFREGAIETIEAPQGGMWTYDFIRRAAVAALKERVALTFSLTKIFDQQPTRECRMPPEPDWSRPKNKPDMAMPPPHENRRWQP
jgi:hypothetical protein